MSTTPTPLASLNLLTVYRRHTQSCTKHYPQGQKVYHPGNKRDKAKDCQCPIVAEGVLPIEGRVVNRSTKFNEWEQAEAVAKQWEQWGQTTEPENSEPVVQNPSVKYAIESFLNSIGASGKNVEVNTYHNFEILLLQRLTPFVEAKKIERIKSFEDLDLCSKFVESWVNLQPTRNRKDVELPTEPVVLADTTKKAELERFRSFLRYCVDRTWLKENPAKKIKFSVKVSKKYGMGPEEEKRVFDGIEKFSDGRGGFGGENARRLRVFALLMRHAGLRISDATSFNEAQLQVRASGQGYAVVLEEMKKTKEWVYTPIPQFLADELQALPFLGDKDGVRYWFWTGQGELDTAANNWYVKIMKVVDAVAAEVQFRHPVTPHSFRHTFSITHLNNGVDIRTVQQWLGHKSVTTTEKHYGHAILGSRIASERAADESLRRQQTAVA